MYILCCQQTFSAKSVMADEAASGGSVVPDQGGETENAGSEPTSPSLEELQRQLAEMEATQAELASRLQQQTDLVEPQLDSRLAVIEEQFRQNFEDRLREAAPASAAGRRGLDRLGGAADRGDVLLVNRVFREVSRCMGDEWRPVFDSLVAPLPPEVVAEARTSLQQHPPLIQVCRSLLSSALIDRIKDLCMLILLCVYILSNHRALRSVEPTFSM